MDGFELLYIKCKSSNTPAVSHDHDQAVVERRNGKGQSETPWSFVLCDDKAFLVESRR